MTTFTAFTTLSDKDSAEALGEALEELSTEPYGVGVFEIEDGSGMWEVGGYFMDAPDDVALALLAAAHGAKSFVVSELPETDWVAKVRRELVPVHAGRFYVYGSHDAETVPDGVEPLLIEAAMAFGTGHHGTTQGCLRALDRLIDAGVTCHNVADIGCGTAVLAMAAARVWPETVLASDMDQVAVDVAEANVRANNLGGRVVCLEALGFEHPQLHAAAPFDLVFANILKQPLIDLAPDMASHLALGGFAILSGILNDQGDEVAEVYARNGINTWHREEIGDWTTLTLQKAAS
ncbi:50S ribosomal protein L11 methyltransferase [Marivita sp. XM-24bin2]|jgi:ribosomal protein L11 methyltransferase|uniref:50S ribosomal protein L11 methyltransferase n=1 Tax=unclassified Marivita TaxID=2632480 RepID=UPI000D7A96A4|nr:50S ribosomal protein L11 methyltransferase [Marivita sp. XM-24bin2]MCR9109370.1 50S ribosomal protein L11 methyltransferase [Paracoccaceae bacterium]PWL35457.1 MAG: 50S ribosomal protein L11 methyltransferase [Marivita sp. XM-24bin2]